MTRKRTIIIGDIHGMLDEFKELIKLVEYNPETDRCISVGDLVDRGPESAECIRYAKRIGAELVIGNHDDKYLRYWRHEQKKTHVGRKHYRNPMNLPPAKMAVWETLTDDDITYIHEGKYCIPLWEYNALVVHAGVLPGKEYLPLDKRDREEYIFTRYINEKTHKQMKLGPNFSQPEGSIHWTEAYDGFVSVVYGHDVQSMTEPVMTSNSKGGRTIGIDTGACFGGSLTAMIFNIDGTEEFRSVKAKKAWKKFKVADEGKKKKNGK